ncbi:glycosyltransferase family 39 protein [Thiobacillus sp.]|uniref:glycosyltransferase family 39 protein n=1 Tax=Thiobacillus sp. TaxID=924 RepID=UPI00286E822E|nr:glycosyltransferase family 39 protein [Thiobacillus sp.]
MSQTRSWAGRLRIFAPLWFIGVVCALMAVHLLMRTPAFPYNPDSASYFEQARSLVQSGTALETPYGLDATDKQASILFPIGYPVVLALLSLPGFDSAATALALSRVSSLLLPLLLFVGFRGLLGAPRAALLAGLATLSPGVLMFATLGTPDLPALLLAVAAVAIVLNARARHWLMLGGLIAGSAYAIRNAHIALLLAIALYYGYRLLTEAAQRRATLLDALAFLLGAALILVPVLLRNVLLFGVFNPYQMEPSTLSVLHNVRTFVQEVAYDVSGWRALGVFVAWSAAGAAVFLGFTASAGWLLGRSWQHLPPARSQTIVLCTLYAAIGASVVIAARSRYEWGEMINTRHTLQYAPFLWATLLAALPTQPRWRPVTAGLVLLAGLLHLAYVATPHDLLARNQKSTAALAVYEAGKGHFCTPGNALLASNWGYVFPILCGAAVRNIEMNALPCPAGKVCPSIASAALQLAQQFPARSIQLGFFAGRGLAPRQLPLAPVDQMQLQHAGMQILQNDAHAFVVIKTPVIQ